MSVIGRLFSGVSDVEAAQSEVDVARARLAHTIEAIRYRTQPSHLLDEATERVRDGASDLAHSAGEIVRERPVAVGVGVAGVGWLLGYGPLGRLIERRRRRRETRRLLRRSRKRRDTNEEGSSS